MSPRLIFMGTPDFAACPLEALIKAGYDIAAVYTRAPQRSGRGMQIRNSPVHALAEQYDLPVETPSSLGSDQAVRRFQSYAPDLAVVAAYGLILPTSILNVPGMGCWNIHASLLPRWRGAAPIQRALMAGDHLTGISIMQMEEGLDTGPVWTSASTPIEEGDTATSLHDRLMVLGAQTLLAALDDWQAGRLPARPTEQDAAAACYAAKIDKSEARIDWSQTATHIHQQIRGLSPFPGAWTDGSSQRIKILSARIDLKRQGPDGQILDADGWIGCGQGALQPLRVQRAGKAEMDYATFLRGQSLDVGQSL